MKRKALATTKKCCHYIVTGLHSVFLQHFTIVTGDVARRFFQWFLGCWLECLNLKEATTVSIFNDKYKKLNSSLILTDCAIMLSSESSFVVRIQQFSKVVFRQPRSSYSSGTELRYSIVKSRIFAVAARKIFYYLCLCLCHSLRPIFETSLFKD